MTRLRGLGYATLVIAFAHLVFGGIVRITGSGMGCGDHWPKCHGYWFPPMNRMDLIIEVTHRYLAAFLILSIGAFVVAAWRRRREPGVGGQGGILRAAVSALVVVVVTALFGALTVFMGNPPSATVVHWVLAASLFAILAAAVIRAGGLGGGTAAIGGGTSKAARGALAAVVIALLAITLGGLTAKVPHAAVACPSFPLCGQTPAATPAGAAQVQLTHRVLAFALFFHLMAMAVLVRRRPENPVVRKAALVAFGAVVLQVLVAGAMIGMNLPPVSRKVHQAVGVLVWITTFIFWYLAHRAARTAAPAVETTSARLPAYPARARVLS